MRHRNRISRHPSTAGAPHSPRVPPRERPRPPRDFSLQPAKRLSVSQVVFDQLLERIRDGALRPGDRLPSEHELMRMLSVGRSSVREALRSLVTMGLVETKPGRGAVVTLQAPSPLQHLESHGRSIEHVQKWALLDLLEVRECLEGQAAQLAAERATRVDLVAIENFAREVEKQIADGKTYFRSNAAFHVAIAKASHNNILGESVRQLIGQVRAFRERAMREIRDMPERDVLEHRAIVAAIRAQDPEGARRAVIRHIRSFADLVRDAYGDTRPRRADRGS